MELIKYVNGFINRFNSDVNISKSEQPSIVLEKLESKIEQLTIMYHSASLIEKEKILSDLGRCYDLLYYYNYKNDSRRTYLLSEKLQNLEEVYVVAEKPERFIIDEDLLNIDIQMGLTMEQANNLLKWTANNTRDNLNKSVKELNYNDDVYDNCSLAGACGFSQFSSLYPLQKMGLKVTVNNIRAINGGAHAYGTVIIPIREDNKIVNKRFLVDCTYRQFFRLSHNVISRFLTSTPDIGFYVRQSEEQTSFSKELLKNGFVEATTNNLEKYLKPFFLTTKKLNEISKAEDEFSKLDILDIIENKQEEFDYEEEEFENWGYNLDVKKENNKQI